MELFDAVRNNKIEKVKRLLQRKNIGLNSTEVYECAYEAAETTTTTTIERFYTPLHVACREGHTQIVALLLQDQRVDVNKQTNERVTPFFIACESGHLDIVKYMMQDERVDVNKQGYNNKGSPFHISCHLGHLDIVKHMMQDERVDVNKQREGGWSPLHASIKHRYVFKLLAEDARVNINVTSVIRKTPLHWACYKLGNDYALRLVKFLISSGRHLDVKLRNREGKTPKDIAKSRGYESVVDLLESYENDKEKTIERLRKEMGLSNLSTNQRLIYSASDGQIQDLKQLLYHRKRLQH